MVDEGPLGIVDIFFLDKDGNVSSVKLLKLTAALVAAFMLMLSGSS